MKPLNIKEKTDKSERSSNSIMKSTQNRVTKWEKICPTEDVEYKSIRKNKGLNLFDRQVVNCKKVLKKPIEGHLGDSVS